MPRGTVKWYNATKGYGFIRPQGGGEDVFVHGSAVERAGLTALSEGQQVEYDLVNSRGRTSAENLKVSRAAIPGGQRNGENASREAASKTPVKTGGFRRLPWLAAAAAAFASYEVAPLIAFWGAQMKGPAANIAELGETPYLSFLNKAATAGRPAAVVGGIVALIAVFGSPETTPGLRATIIGAVAGGIGGCIVGFLVGYF